MLAIASQVPTPRTHPVNECLVPVSNELKNKGGIAGEDSFGVFAATRVLRVAVGGSERGSALSDWTGVPAVGTVAVSLVPGGARISACPRRKPWSCLVVPRTNESFTMHDDRRRELIGLADQRGNAVEIFLRVVVDDDLPPLGRFGSDQHGGAEPLVQMLFKLDQVGQPGLRGVCLIATDSRPSRGGNAGGHEGLGLADREVLGDDPAAGGDPGSPGRAAPARRGRGPG